MVRPVVARTSIWAQMSFFQLSAMLMLRVAFEVTSSLAQVRPAISQSRLQAQRLAVST